MKFVSLIVGLYNTLLLQFRLWRVNRQLGKATRQAREATLAAEWARIDSQLLKEQSDAKSLEDSLRDVFSRRSL